MYPKGGICVAIDYEVFEIKDIDRIRPLWEKLRDHHGAISESFGAYYGSLTFPGRRREWQDKVISGSLMRIDIAKDTTLDVYVGYSVSTITSQGEGEIESMYVEPGYRRKKIGESLMKKALAWMDTYPAKTKKLHVACGNEEVLEFYGRAGFYPKYMVLEQAQ